MTEVEDPVARYQSIRWIPEEEAMIVVLEDVETQLTVAAIHGRDHLPQVVEVVGSEMNHLLCEAHMAEVLVTITLPPHLEEVTTAETLA